MKDTRWLICLNFLLWLVMGWDFTDKNSLFKTICLAGMGINFVAMLIIQKQTGVVKYEI